jgi:HNH endonuclease
MITQERLKEVLTYDYTTGQFTNRISRPGGKGKIGAVVGYVNRDGYVRICIDAKYYLAHRLAWLYEYGAFPDYVLDHINGNTGDNCLVNLRPATIKQNMENQKLHSSNKSGYRGVSWDKSAKRWIASVKHQRQMVQKSFINLEDAVKAVKQMRDELFTHHKTEYAA